MSGRSVARSASWRRVLPSFVAAGATLALWVFILRSDAATLSVRRAFAVVTSVVLNAFGSATVARGTDIVSADFGISVVTACTGLFISGLFVAAVAAFPVSWRARLFGAAVGLGALFVVNVVRLASLYYIGIHWPSALEPIHQLVWQSLVIAVAVALWLLWAARASRRSRRAA